MTVLHCDWFGGLRARCDSSVKLDPKRDLSSPECAGMPPCPTCLLLATHLRKETSHAPHPSP